MVESCERDHSATGTDVHHMVDISPSAFKMLFFPLTAINNVFNVCLRVWEDVMAVMIPIFLKLSIQ